MSDTLDNSGEPPADSPKGDRRSSPVRTISSENLLCGDKAIVILHAGEAYRLIVTRNDKLLLQK